MSLENVVNSNVINHVILANLYYDSGVVSMCNAFNDIDYDNKVYMATGNLSSISSSLVREISSFGGDVSKFVHASVLIALKEKKATHE